MRYALLVVFVLAVTFLITKYLIFSLNRAFPQTARHKWLPLLLAVSVLGLVFLGSERRIVGTLTQRYVSYAVYLLFVFLLTFFAYGIFVEIFILLRRFFAGTYERQLSVAKSRLIFFVISAIGLFTVCVGIGSMQDLSVTRFELRSPKISRPTRVVQLSDLHFSSIIDEKFARKVVELTNAQKPDLIVMTGDYVDPGVVSPERVTEEMNRLEAPLGKYGISGNHEFYTGYLAAMDFIEKNGFITLRNEKAEVGRNIVLFGVDDKLTENLPGTGPLTEVELLNESRPENYNIFLKHRPEIEEGSEEHFDLMLSGHTHGGQIFPLSIVAAIANRYFIGRYTLDNASTIFVSKGTGAWGPPIRFAASPEIIVIDLLP